MSRSLLASAVAALALAVPATATAQAPAIGQQECPDGTPNEAVCGSLTVPLDHSGGTAGTVTLQFARVPAAQPKRGALVVLTGGPGEAAIPLADEISGVLGAGAGAYDRIFVDQRGTGRSDKVDCPTVKTAADVRRCAENLGARRPFYTTRETALDLEDLRRALGEPSLTLMGISYGATVAGYYARAFPASTAGVILDSPAPVDGQDAVEQLRQLALPRVMREVCWPPSCRDFLTDPTRALAALVRRTARRALRGPVVQVRGRIRQATMTTADLYSLIVLSDRDPVLRAELPAAIASANLGDPAPILRLVAAAKAQGSESSGISESRALATNCVEGRLPWAPESPVAEREAALEAFAQQAAAAYRPFPSAVVLAASFANLCSVWPSTPRPEGVPQRGPDVPVLVLAGRDDLRTPLEDARRTGSQYPNARVLGVPDVGHSVLANDESGCAVGAIGAFLAGQPVANCPAAERKRVTRAPFIPASVRDLRPARGLRGLTGRTATAVLVTLLEIERTATIAGRVTGGGDTIRAAGLRGGTARLGDNTFTLRAFEIIRGVRISGTIGERSGRLTITGPGGITGVLRSRGTGTLRGTIGGEPVVIRG